MSDKKYTTYTCKNCNAFIVRIEFNQQFYGAHICNDCFNGLFGDFFQLEDEELKEDKISKEYQEEESDNINIYNKGPKDGQ